MHIYAIFKQIFPYFQAIMSITYDNLEYLLNIMCGYEGTDKAHPHSPARECRMRLIHICKTLPNF